MVILKHGERCKSSDTQSNDEIVCRGAADDSYRVGIKFLLSLPVRDQVNSEDQSSLDENTETQDIKGNLRKVIVFLVVVTSLAAVYQIMIFNFVLPNREIHWQKTTLPQVQTYDEQGRRFAVLVLLEQDLGDATQPLTLFQKPEVREEFNRLRLATLALPVNSESRDVQEWMKSKSISRLPALLLYATGYSEPVRLNASQLDANQLVNTLKDVRFQRYEP